MESTYGWENSGAELVSRFTTLFACGIVIRRMCGGKYTGSFGVLFYGSVLAISLLLSSSDPFSSRWQPWTWSNTATMLSPHLALWVIMLPIASYEHDTRYHHGDYSWSMCNWYQLLDIVIAFGIGMCLISSQYVAAVIILSLKLSLKHLSESWKKNTYIRDCNGW